MAVDTQDRTLDLYYSDVGLIDFDEIKRKNCKEGDILTEIWLD